MNYHHKQTKEAPLYPDLIWDKPESKLHAGKLLIIGGNAHSFTAPANAYITSEKAGIGTAKVLLPDALKKTVGSILENGEYAPSTKSGSFSRKALSSWLDFASWADAVVLPGDLGRNSETAILLEQFITKYPGMITITQDALDYFTGNPLHLLERSNTTIVTSFAGLQKMAIAARFGYAFTYDMPLSNMIENLHLLTTIYPAVIVIKHNGIFYVAQDGEVSTTKTSNDENVWRVESASTISVWTLQHPNKTFAAASSAVLELITQ